MNTFLIVVIFGSMLVSPLHGTARKADLVLKNGVIYTVDKDMSRAEAVALSGDEILAVGSDEEIATFIDEDTRVIDLEGRTVVPGFTDSHYHYTAVGKREFYLNLDGTRSLQDFLKKVEQEVQAHPKGDWIIGRGWIEEDWPTKEFPTKQDLDKVAPDNPTMLRRADGHAAVVNSRALEIAGINADTANPDGGEILRDKTGDATGMLIDKAMELVRKHTPSDSTAQRLRQFAMKAQEVAFGYGLTQVHDMGTDWKIVDVWKQMYETGDLKIRIYAYIRGPGEAVDSLLASGPQTGMFDHRLTVRGIKITQDGALGSRGAALLETYSDEETRGLLMYEESKLLPIIKSALNNNIQMAIHAIGDRANRNVLDLYKQALTQVPPERRSHMPPRFRIEHAQIVALEDIPRFAELGVIPSMQPSHAIGDLHFAVRRLGLNRLKGAYAWRTFIDNGGYIPAGSDAPVEEGNPMIEFYAACVRKDTTGFSAEGWHPELKMTREEALKSLTIWGAKAAFQEDLRGSLEPGKLADLVVLERDLMTEPEERLFDIDVLMTMVGGEVVFDRDRTSQSKR